MRQKNSQPTIGRDNVINVKMSSVGKSIIPPELVPQIGMMNDAAVASVKSVIESELEIVDPVIREPLVSFTYAKDIWVETNRGENWSELYSYQSEDYGITNGANESPIYGAPTTEIPKAQAEFDKDYFRTHIWAVTLRFNHVDLKRGDITRHSIEAAHQRSLRTLYDSHLDQLTYVGLPQYDRAGILNQPDVTPVNLSGSWSGKTPQQIMDDLNQMLTEGGKAVGLSSRAFPNHIALPWELYSKLVNTPITNIGEDTILRYFLRNNVVAAQGIDLKITWNKYADTAGQGGTSRIAVYNDNPEFLKLSILTPLSRQMFNVNTEKVSYDSLYMSVITEPMLFYPDSMRYYDGA